MSELSVARRVNALCRRFERLWRAGARPVIGEALAEVTPAERPTLFAELLPLEVELRREAGESPEAREYIQLYPDYEEVVASVLGRSPPDSQTLVQGGPSPVPAAPVSAPVSAGKELPRRIAGYEVRGLLGQGGMGIVYLAWEPALDRLVALKVIRSDVTLNAENLLRLRAEAEAVARLSHPNIVRIHAVAEHHGQPVLCLEYVPGGSLGDHLRGQPQPVVPSAMLTGTLARAMEHAHCQGVVHRDLKPANVLLQPPDGGLPGAPISWPDCSPRISDFGLARRLGANAGLTAGYIAGTPSYMAPEQAAGRSADVSPATDVWALGAILYELLTGRPPFRGEDVTQTLAQVMTTDPVPPSRLRPVSRDLETVCLKCLQKEPAKRYTRAAELADDLDRFLDGRPVRARRTPWYERLARTARRHPTATAMAGLALLSLTVGVGMTAWQARRAEGEARRAEGEARRAETRQARLQLDLALQQCEAGDVRQGLRGLARALRTAEHAWADDLIGPIRVNLASWSTQLARPAGERDHLGRALASEMARLVKGDAAVKLQLRTLAVCPRTGRLATGGEMGLVQLWQPDGTPLHKPLGQGWRFLLRQRAALSLALSPDGEMIAVADAGGETHRYRVATGQLLDGTITHGKIDLWAIAFSPDGKLLVTGNNEGRLGFWDPATGKPARADIDTDTRSAVFALAFAPRTGTLYSATRNGWIHGWDVATGKRRGTHLQTPDREAHALAVRPDSRALLVGGARSARFYELPSLRPLEPVLEHIRRVDGVAFSSDGAVAVTAGHDGWVRFWRAATRQPLGETLRLPGRINEAAFLPGTRTAVLAVHQGQAVFWEAPLDRAVGPPRDHGQPAHGFQFTSDGGLLSCSAGRLLLGHGGEPRQLPRSAKGASGRRAAALSPDGKKLAVSYHGSNVVEIHPPADPAAALVLVHEQLVTGLEFTEGGEALLTVTDDDPTRESGFSRWDLAAPGKATRRYFVAGAACFAVSPDGRRVALGGKRRAWVCDIGTGEQIGPDLPHSDAVREVAWSRDGQTLLTGAEDGAVRMWETSGVRRGPTFRHQAQVRSLAFGPDGRTVLSGSADGTARFWDVATGVPLGPPLLHGAVVNQVAFEPGGEAVVTCSDNGAVQRWLLPDPPFEGEPETDGAID